MPRNTTNVFISYSHTDGFLVAPIVKLLRANRSLVFQDIDSIQPGKRWRREISKGLTESHLVVLFWCDHAKGSDEVATEWRTAIELEKDLLPLVLDDTPLPQELREYQWIDFRDTVGTNHTERTGCIPGTPLHPEPLFGIVTIIRRLRWWFANISSREEANFVAQELAHEIEDEIVRRALLRQETEEHFPIA